MHIGFSLSLVRQALKYFLFSGPAVSSITSASQVEGTSLVHTVTLASAVSGSPATYAFSIGGTAIAGTDYNATPTFSAGVTLNAGILTVPLTTTSFTITVATVDTAIYEGTRGYTVTVGAMSNTGTITDNESAPVIASVSSASAIEGSSIVHTVAIAGTARAAQTYTLTLSGGTATGGGVDYTSTLTNANLSAGVTISGSTITVPPGVTSFTVSVPTATDALVEGNETYTLTVGAASGTGTIIDANKSYPKTFFLNLSSPSGVTIADNQSLITINQYSGPASLAAALATVMAGGSVSATGSTITPSVVGARSSGVAPLSVFFDASGTTAPALTSLPFTELLHFWHYGDTSPGNWTYGARTGLSKNYSFGPMGSHVYETAGTFTVKYSAFFVNSSGTLSCAATSTWTVTVSAADTVFAANTVCFSNTGNFTGAPAGSTHITATDYATAINTYQGTYKRMLFQRGETWTATAVQASITTTGPGIIGTFGSGALPVLKSTAGYGLRLSSASTPGLADWRVMDLNIDGQNVSGGWDFTGGINQVLILRLSLVNCLWAGGASDWGLASDNVDSNSAYHGHTIWDQMSIVDCTSPSVNGGVAVGGMVNSYICATRLTFMGNWYDNQGGGEHVIRTPYVGGGVFSNNYLANPAPTKHTWQLHAPAWIASTYSPAFTTLYSDGTYSQNIVISNNTHINTGSAASNATWVVYIGCQNADATHDEHLRNIVIEGNYLYSAANMQSYVIRGTVTNVSIRNNISNTGGATSQGWSAYAPPTYITYANNTIYSSVAWSTFYAFGVLTATINPTNISGVNNLMYAPSSGRVDLVPYYDQTISSNGVDNSTSSQTLISPNFVNTPSTAITQLGSSDFVLNTGSYGIAAGTYVPGVFLDAKWNVRPTAINMGAL